MYDVTTTEEQRILYSTTLKLNQKSMCSWVSTMTPGRLPDRVQFLCALRAPESSRIFSRLPRTRVVTDHGGVVEYSLQTRFARTVACVSSGPVTTKFRRTNKYRPRRRFQRNNFKRLNSGRLWLALYARAYGTDNVIMKKNACIWKRKREGRD